MATHEGSSSAHPAPFSLTSVQFRSHSNVSNESGLRLSRLSRETCCRVLDTDKSWLASSLSLYRYSFRKETTRTPSSQRTSVSLISRDNYSFTCRPHRVGLLSTFHHAHDSTTCPVCQPRLTWLQDSCVTGSGFGASARTDF